MTSTTNSKSLRTFLIVWGGQLVSNIGSSMSSFAITLWAWELTTKATPLALIGFFSLVPSILISPFAGAMVDRSNRKFLLIIGDIVSILLTGIIVLLYLTHHLQIWHFYVAATIRSTFNQLQNLTYSASLTLMLPEQHYARAGGLQYLSGYGSGIIALTLAGALYYVIGLVGILLLDLLSFVVAISSVLVVFIPQPVGKNELLLKQRLIEGENQGNQQFNREAKEEDVLQVSEQELTPSVPPALSASLASSLPTTHNRTHWLARLAKDFGVGWSYLGTHPSLLALLVIQSAFMFIHDIGGSIGTPMLLARSGNSAQALASINAAGCVGGVSGALLTATWGGPTRRIQGILLTIVGAGLSKTVVGFGQTLWVWLPAQVCSSFNFPVKGGCEQAIWLAKVPPQVQGRVFAVTQMVLQSTAAVARLLAGPLADRVFEPTLLSSGWLVSVFGGLVGTGPGAGLALLYILSSLGLLLVGLGAYAWPVLRKVEDLVPDYEVNL